MSFHAFYYITLLRQDLLHTVQLIQDIFNNIDKINFPLKAEELLGFHIRGLLLLGLRSSIVRRHEIFKYPRGSIRLHYHVNTHQGMRRRKVRTTLPIELSKNSINCNSLGKVRWNKTLKACSRIRTASC